MDFELMVLLHGKALENIPLLIISHGSNLQTTFFVYTFRQIGKKKRIFSHLVYFSTLILKSL